MQIMCEAGKLKSIDFMLKHGYPWDPYNYTKAACKGQIACYAHLLSLHLDKDFDDHCHHFNQLTEENIKPFDWYDIHTRTFLFDLNNHPKFDQSCPLGNMIQAKRQEIELHKAYALLECDKKISEDVLHFILFLYF